MSLPPRAATAPYCSARGVTIYHGDAREIVPFLRAAVLVTDPPYGMGYASGWSGSTVENDGDTSTRDAVLAAWAPKPALVFGRWDCPRPTGVRARLVWDKGEWPGMGDLSFPWGPSDEEIYVLGGGFVGKREGTVLRSNRIPAAHATHPTAKPVALLERLLSHCPPGVVLDPFMGTGSVLEACQRVGREVIGIEIKEHYCELASKRLAQGALEWPEGDHE